MADDSANALTVRVPAVAACAVTVTLRASPTASATGLQEMLLALARHERPSAPKLPIVMPAGTSIDSRASAAAAGPALFIVTVSVVSSPTTRLAGVAMRVTPRSAIGSVTTSTVMLLLPGAASLAANTLALRVSVPRARPVSDSVTVRLVPGASEPSEQLACEPMLVQVPPAALIASSVLAGGTVNAAETRSAVRVPIERTVKVSE